MSGREAGMHGRHVRDMWARPPCPRQRSGSSEAGTSRGDHCVLSAPVSAPARALSHRDKGRTPLCSTHPQMLLPRGLARTQGHLQRAPEPEMRTLKRADMPRNVFSVTLAALDVKWVKAGGGGSREMGNSTTNKGKHVFYNSTFQGL